MKIMVVDDEELIRSVIKEYASIEGFEVDEASDGLEAVQKCKSSNYDLIVMDIMMPKLDGYQAVKEIHKEKNIPILMLSARGEEYDKLLGFDLGIDDYVMKPFSPKELMARIKAITKRVNKSTPKIVLEDLIIDDSAREVIVAGEKILLTLKEYELLKYLVENKNIAISREQLLMSIWGYDFYGDDRTIDTHIKTLRSKIGKYKESIVTLRGVGYKFEYKE
ncbi:MAG: response regulator transcription factor [Bacilli bacterium]|nr:response regulator transcription factor [Bacilli bacterium]